MKQLRIWELWTRVIFLREISVVKLSRVLPIHAPSVETNMSLVVNNAIAGHISRNISFIKESL